MFGVFYLSVVVHDLGFFMIQRYNVAKNNKTRFFYVLYSDKTWLFDQSECVQGPVSIV